ncbi:hypothetical protein PUN28_006727 [Cardiocondyla obscurior]|uniref:Uncharacterized protein n=1 Tax=Cardiocondyla obscurior TaxID=286306 RepID=A0AAW2G139_9HYME
MTAPKFLFITVLVISLGSSLTWANPSAKPNPAAEAAAEPNAEAEAEAEAVAAAMAEAFAEALAEANPGIPLLKEYLEHWAKKG